MSSGLVMRICSERSNLATGQPGADRRLDGRQIPSSSTPPLLEECNLTLRSAVPHRSLRARDAGQPRSRVAETGDGEATRRISSARSTEVCMRWDELSIRNLCGARATFLIILPMELAYVDAPRMWEKNLNPDWTNKIPGRTS